MIGFKLSQFLKGRAEAKQIANYLLYEEDIQFQGAEKKFTPYVIPIERRNNCMYAQFFVDDLLEHPFVFTKNTRRFTKEYYSFAEADGKFALYPLSPAPKGFLELPLRRTPHKATVSGEGPFTLYGLKFTEFNTPIVLLSETDESKKYNILFDKNGILTYGFFTNPGVDDVMEEIYDEYDGSMPPLEIEFLPEVTDESIDQVFDDMINEEETTRAPAVIIKGLDMPEKKEGGEIEWMRPTTIVDYLDRFVIGQDAAKKTMAVAISNYMAKVQNQDKGMQIDNQLLVGPSGVGKTYIVDILALAAQLKVARASLTGKSCAGFIGAGIMEVFSAFKEEKSDAPYGIVFFDEIDKLGEALSNRGWGNNLQDELIGILENGEVYVDLPQYQYRRLSTENMLFLFAGAFNTGGSHSLESIVKGRLGKQKNEMGFGKSFVQEDLDWRHKLLEEDFIAYGLKPELLGRVTSYTALDPLTEEQLMRILFEPENSLLDRYGRVCEAKGLRLQVTKDALKSIAATGKSTLGARSLRNVCNRLFTEVLYDPWKHAQEDKLIIDAPVVEAVLQGMEVPLPEIDPPEPEQEDKPQNASQDSQEPPLLTSGKTRAQ